MTASTVISDHRPPNIAPSGEDASPDRAVPPPARAAGVELLGPWAASGYRDRRYLVRRADGQTVQLTELLYVTLDAIDGRRTLTQLAAQVGERVGKHVTAADVRFLVELKLVPIGLLRGPDGSEPVVRKINPLLALRLRYVIADPRVTARVTAPFAWLFRPLIVIALLVAFGAVSAWVLFGKGLASSVHQVMYEPGILLALIGLGLVAAGFHEVGHAAACRYGGATPGAMGVGLYLIWPAFYTDVTDSYRLDRR